MYTCWSFIVHVVDVSWVTQFCLLCIPVGHLLYRCSWLFTMYTCWSFIVQMFLSVYYVYLLVIYCTDVLDCLLCIPVGHLLYRCSWLFTMYTCWSFIVQMFLSVYYVYLLVIYCTHVTWLFNMYTCWSFNIHVFDVSLTCWLYYVYLLVIYCTDVSWVVYYVYLLVIYCTHVLECLICIPVGHLLYRCSWLFNMYTCWSFIVQMFLIV